jgi:histidine ammonia-lyase
VAFAERGETAAYQRRAAILALLHPELYPSAPRDREMIDPRASWYHGLPPAPPDARDRSEPLQIGGALSLERCAELLLASDGQRPRVEVDTRTLVSIARARGALDRIVASGATRVYGIQTGLGSGKADPIDAGDGDQQLRLLRSHAVGFGPELPRSIVRLAMVLRAHALASGAIAGASPEVVSGLVKLVNSGLTPVCHERGPNGIGDLQIHATFGLLVAGDPSVRCRLSDGREVSGAEALAEIGLSPVTTGAAIAVMSGTSALTAGAVDVLERGERLIARLEEGGHPQAAAQLERLCREPLEALRASVRREINSASGSPLQVLDSRGRPEVISGCNWDSLGLGLGFADLAAGLACGFEAVRSDVEGPELIDWAARARDRMVQRAVVPAAYGGTTAGGQEHANGAARALERVRRQLDDAEEILRGLAPGEDPPGVPAPSLDEVIAASRWADAGELGRTHHRLLDRSARVSELAASILAAYLDADLALSNSSHPEPHRLRGDPGQIAGNQAIRIARGRSRWRSPQRERVQDSTLHRSLPVTLGVLVTALTRARDPRWEAARESDPVLRARALDQLQVAVLPLILAADQALGRLMNPATNSRLPLNLSGAPAGAEHGFGQIEQNAHAIAAEARERCFSRVASLGLGVLGHKSTASRCASLLEAAADGLEEQLERAEELLALLALSVVQAIDLRVALQGLRFADLGPAARHLYRAFRAGDPAACSVRSQADTRARGGIPMLREDRALGTDQARALEIVHELSLKRPSFVRTANHERRDPRTICFSGLGWSCGST